MEQFSRRRTELKYGRERALQFVTETLVQGHEWIGSRIASLPLQNDERIVMIRRAGRIMVPAQDTVVTDGDMLVLYND